MKTNKTCEVGKFRLLVGVAVVGVAVTAPIAAAVPAAAVPASPGVVRTEFPPCEKHEFMCKSVYDPCERGHDNWNGGGYGWDRRGDYDRCERERGPGWDRGWNNFFPFDLFGSS